MIKCEKGSSTFNVDVSHKKLQMNLNIKLCKKFYKLYKSQTFLLKQSLRTTPSLHYCLF